MTTMIHSLMRSLAPLTLLLCAFGLGACQQGDDLPTARSAALDNASGIKLLISDAGDLSPEQVHAISQSVEGQAQDVSTAMVRLQKDDGEGGGPASLEIELWGAGVPDSGALVSQLKADFPALADVAVEVVNLGPGSGPMPLSIEIDEEATAEETKQQIIESLQADGVEGNIDVQVEELEDGRRVEVKVEHESAEE